MSSQDPHPPLPEAPPPIPPAEMPRGELAALVDEGRVLDIEEALRGQNVRLPTVLGELDRILDAGLGNLATALATMLISRFRVAQSDKLARRVLAHQNTAGLEELVDMAAALIQQERLNAAAETLNAVFARGEDDRALYLSARIAARRGHAEDAFARVSRASPELLGAAGLATQARYAALIGKPKAVAGALRNAERQVSEEDQPYLEHVRRLVARVECSSALPQPWDLRIAHAIEYGSLLIEHAPSPGDGGRFGLEVMTPAEVGRVIDAMIDAIQALGLPITKLYYANEDGEIIAAALEHRLGIERREWMHDREVTEGSWLCSASAATHPHLKRAHVEALQAALDEGTLRSLALMLPVGWRGPMVPDVVGRLTGDDELPWAIDDEVEDVLETLFDGAPSVAAGFPVGPFAPLLRAAQDAPRAPHVPFLDETPILRGHMKMSELVPLK